MINKILLGSVSGAALIAMGFLSWQGWQLDQARKAVAHQKAVNAVLARDLLAQKAAVKIETVTKRVYVQAEKVKHEINATDCNSVVPVWRDGIERVRQHAQADASDSDTTTNKP
jgi:hypothetical protein